MIQLSVNDMDSPFLSLNTFPSFSYLTFVRISTVDKIMAVKNDSLSDVDLLKGVMKANVGDYIIKGVNGEFYPCRQDIFEKTYDKADDSSVMCFGDVS